jgi:hypothetical protein
MNKSHMHHFDAEAGASPFRKNELFHFRGNVVFYMDNVLVFINKMHNALIKGIFQ